MRLTVQDAIDLARGVKIVGLEIGNKVIRLITQKIDEITKRVFDIIGIRLPKEFKGGGIEKFIKGQHHQDSQGNGCKTLYESQGFKALKSKVP